MQRAGHGTCMRTTYLLFSHNVRREQSTLKIYMYLEGWYCRGFHISGVWVYGLDTSDFGCWEDCNEWEIQCFPNSDVEDSALPGCYAVKWSNLTHTERQRSAAPSPSSLHSLETSGCISYPPHGIHIPWPESSWHWIFEFRRMWVIY